MAKIRSVGTTISVNSKEIGGVNAINGVEITADTIDVTSLDSDGGYREFIGGFKDGGEVGIDGALDAETGTNQQTMFDALQAGTAVPCIITYPNGSKWTFSGVVTKFATSADLEDVVTFSASIKVSGAPTFVLVPTP